jgi:hypothetical protein
MLHENIEDVPLLVDRPPPGVAFRVDGDKYLIQMPLIAWAGPPAAEVIRILLPELPAPLADGFIGHDDATDKEQLFHVTGAQRETDIAPDGVADDLPWEPMVFVEMGCGRGCHSSSRSGHGGERRAHSSHEELLGSNAYVIFC